MARVVDMAPSVIKVAVTPEMAEAALESSKQDNFREQKVQRYAGQMSMGRWKVNERFGTPVTFDRNRLRNGNHRMRAIVATGLTIELYVRAEPELLDKWQRGESLEK